MFNLSTMIPLQSSAFSFEECVALSPLFGVALLSFLNVLWMGVWRQKSAQGIGIFSGVVLAFLAALSLFLVDVPSHLFFNGMLKSDAFFYFFSALFCSVGSVCCFCALPLLKKNRLAYPEFYALLVFSILGMMVMVAGVHFMVIFIALELMSLSVYALVGFQRANPVANEASLKYFIIGSLASAFFLYGVSFIYGVLGTLSLVPLVVFIQSAGSEPLLFIGILFVLMGFFVKVACAPFHLWLPDVYEGSMSLVTGFMASALKAAYFAVLMRFWSAFGFHPEVSHFLLPKFFQFFQGLMSFLCILTLVVGNFIALKQTGVKRMLGFSAIAHTGYLFLGLIAGSYQSSGFAAIFGYLCIYSLVIMGAFLLLSALEKDVAQKITLEDFSGFAETRPFLAFFFSVFLLSLAGIPPLAGFFAKYSIFYAAIQAGSIWLSVIAICCSAVSAGYYLRILIYMYMLPVAKKESPFVRDMGFFMKGCIGFLGLITLFWGFFPSVLFSFQQFVVHAFLAG